MTNEEIIAKYAARAKQQDDEFKAFLLREIPNAHRYYAKTKRPVWLDIAKNLGIALAKVDKSD